MLASCEAGAAQEANPPVDMSLLKGAGTMATDASSWVVSPCWALAASKYLLGRLGAEHPSAGFDASQWGVYPA